MLGCLVWLARIGLLAFLSDVLYVFSSTSLLHFAPRDLVHHYNQETCVLNLASKTKKSVYQRVNLFNTHICMRLIEQRRKKETGRRKSTVYARDARDAEMGGVHASCSLN